MARNWYGNIGEFMLMGVVIREKWDGNMTKIWVNIVGELVGNVGKIGWKIR